MQFAALSFPPGFDIGVGISVNPEMLVVANQEALGGKGEGVSQDDVEQASEYLYALAQTKLTCV